MKRNLIKNNKNDTKLIAVGYKEFTSVWKIYDVLLKKWKLK